MASPAVINASGLFRLTAGTATQWVESNPVLPSHVVGYETDTRKMKVGDGVTRYTSLEYMIATPTSHNHDMDNVDGLSAALNDKAPASHTHTAADVGAPTLTDGKLDTTQTTYPFVTVSASRTIQASDLGKFLRATAAVTLTLPSIVLTDGFEFNVLRAGTGAVTVTAPSGVSINGVSAGSVSISEQYKAVG